MNTVGMVRPVPYKRTGLFLSTSSVAKIYINGTDGTNGTKFFNWLRKKEIFKCKT